MRTALIVSLNFRAAHVSHLLASYYQMADLGFRPVLLVAPEFADYLPDNVRFITSLDDPETPNDIAVAIFWFPCLKNIPAMLRLRIKHKAKIIYVFHEPIEKFSTYLASGNSRWWTTKFFAKYYVGLSFLTLSDKVLLPSKKAVSLYENGLSKIANRNYGYLPLLYSDEPLSQTPQRLYFSYIGSINHDHAFGNYVDYIHHLFTLNRYPQLKFLIASWRNVPDDPRLSEMEKAGRLKIVSGKPMSNDEINLYYASSYVVWNAYNRSTQSGVLAKSFMFGTPGLVMRHNLSEFVEDGREVKAVNSNSDFKELDAAIDDVLSNFDRYSLNARHNYERNYDYKNHNTAMQGIINSLS